MSKSKTRQGQSDLLSSYLSRVDNINSFSPEQNDRHFLDDIFRWIFANEKICIFIQISLKFVPTGSIDNNQVLV